MTRLIRTFVPIYNWGQALAFLALMLPVVAIAAFDDPDLALHLGIGGYFGVVGSMLVLGLAPDEVEIGERDILPLEARLDAARLLTRIGDRLWAPTRYQSWWWASDRISIVRTADGKILLKARRRDLKLLRKALRF